MRPERQPFYHAVTPGLFRGSLPDWQREPMDRIIDEGEARARRVEECAYVLATAYWETGRFKHKEEIGRGEGKAYGVDVPLMGTGSRVTKSARYHGRSWPQWTWLENYAKLSVAATLHYQRPIDFVNSPDLLVTDLGFQAWAMWEGFVTGMWTTLNLADFTDAAGVLDYVRARQIVNGMDKAEEIAAFAREFEAALRLIGEAPPVASACPLGRGDCPRAA